MNNRSHQGRPPSLDTQDRDRGPPRHNTSLNTSSHARLHPSRSLTAPRLHTSRSTSSMTTLQSYPSSSLSSLNTFSNTLHTYDPYYLPPLPPLGSSLHSSSSTCRNQTGFASGAGGHSMQMTRSLGGLATTSNSNSLSSFPSMPSYEMGRLDNLDAQALAHSLAHPNPSTNMRVSRRTSSSSRTLTEPSPQYNDDEGLYVSPKLIMDPLASSGSAGFTSRRSSGRHPSSSSSVASMPTTAIQSQYTQNRTFSGSSSENHSAHSSPLAARNLETTLSPALFPSAAAWEDLPPALASLPPLDPTSRHSSSSLVSSSRRGSLASSQYQLQYDGSPFAPGSSIPVEPYPNFTSLQNVSSFGSAHPPPPYIPDSGYSTQGRPSPLPGHVFPNPSQVPGTANNFRYANTEAVSVNSIPRHTSMSAQNESNYGLSRTRSYNNLSSANQHLSYAQTFNPSFDDHNPRPSRSRTQQNMQGLLHSDHMNEGFPGEWSSAFR